MIWKAKTGHKPSPIDSDAKPANEQETEAPQFAWFRQASTRGFVFSMDRLNAGIGFVFRSWILLTGC